jgi:hypothetical protein
MKRKREETRPDKAQSPTKKIYISWGEKIQDETKAKNIFCENPEMQHYEAGIDNNTAAGTLNLDFEPSHARSDPNEAPCAVLGSNYSHDTIGDIAC